VNVAVDTPQGRTCGFSESVDFRRQSATAVARIAEISALSAEATREILVQSRVIGGTVTYRGFDGRVRSYRADTPKQARELRSTGAVGAMGRVIVLYGVADSAADVGSGIRSGNDKQVFDGFMSFLALLGGMSNPAFGISLGAVLVSDGLIEQDGNRQTVFNLATSPCDPAFRPAR
jgi:hypothetical protein